MLDLHRRRRLLQRRRGIARSLRRIAAPSAKRESAEPGEQVGNGLNPPTASRTAPTSAASPSSVAWRKPPTGKRRVRRTA